MASRGVEGVIEGRGAGIEGVGSTGGIYGTGFKGAPTTNQPPILRNILENVYDNVLLHILEHSTMPL